MRTLTVLCLLFGVWFSTATADPASKPTFGVNSDKPTPKQRMELGLANQTGVLVASVYTNGVAHRAGLRAGDFIVAINQTAIQSNDDIPKIKENVKFGDEFEIQVFRNSKFVYLTGVFEPWSVIYNFEFPDGDVLPVAQQRPEYKNPKLPESLAYEFDELSTAAEAGDGEAAYAIYMSLNGCQVWQFKSSTALEKAIDSIKAKGEFTREDGGTMSIGGNWDDHIKFMRETYYRCLGVTKERVQDNEKWLKLAAEAGQPQAMRLYAQRLQHGMYSYKTGAEQAYYWTKLWEMGSLSATGPYGELLMKGWEGQEADKITGYAYSFLRHQSSIAALFFYDTQCSSTDRMIDYYDSKLAKLKSQLEPAELTEAYALAKRLLVENGACCY